RNKIQPEGSGLRDAEDKMIRGRGADRSGFEGERILFPVSGDSGYVLCGDNFAALVVDKADGDRADGIGASLGVERSFIGGVGAEREAPVAVVEHSRGVPGAGLLYF